MQAHQKEGNQMIKRNVVCQSARKLPQQINAGLEMDARWAGRPRVHFWLNVTFMSQAASWYVWKLKFSCRSVSPLKSVLNMFVVRCFYGFLRSHTREYWLTDAGLMALVSKVLISLCCWILCHYSARVIYKRGSLRLDTHNHWIGDWLKYISSLAL